jgi:hypothetical protein
MSNSSSARPSPPSRLVFLSWDSARKPAFETGRVLDLNTSYQNLIKPAVEASGLECIRADEIVLSRLIDVPMYEQLLKADMVSDLSTSNRNANYGVGASCCPTPISNRSVESAAKKDSNDGFAKPPDLTQAKGPAPNRRCGTTS